jgi:hypothetical protein
MKRIISALLVLVALFCVSCKKEERVIVQVKNSLEKNGFTVTVNQDRENLKALTETIKNVYQLGLKGSITAQLTAKGQYEGADCIIEAIEFENADEANVYFNHAVGQFGRDYVITRGNVVIMSTSSTALGLIN